MATPGLEQQYAQMAGATWGTPMWNPMTNQMGQAMTTPMGPMGPMTPLAGPMGAAAGPMGPMTPMGPMGTMGPTGEGQAMVFHYLQIIYIER